MTAQVQGASGKWYGLGTDYAVKMSIDSGLHVHVGQTCHNGCCVPRAPRLDSPCGTWEPIGIPQESEED